MHGCPVTKTLFARAGDGAKKQKWPTVKLKMRYRAGFYPSKRVVDKFGPQPRP